MNETSKSWRNMTPEEQHASILQWLVRKQIPLEVGDVVAFIEEGAIEPKLVGNIFTPADKADVVEITELTNADRARRAARIISDCHMGRKPDAANITDLLADIAHLCGRENLDFGAIVESALAHYRAEVAEALEN